jgi:hypothetical protein
MGASAVRAKLRRMDEEKAQPFLKRNLHRCVLCGQAAAIVSVLLVVRKRLANKHHRRSFPLLGH